MGVATSVARRLRPFQIQSILVVALMTLHGAALAAVGRTHGEFDVSATGASGYSIPLNLPPGAHGLTPALALRYDQRGGNGNKPSLRYAAVVEVLGGLKMLLPRPFAVGLLAYLRQAALSLHRAPSSFRKAMKEYYDARKIPEPRRVISRLDSLTRNDVQGPLRRLIVRLRGTSIRLSSEQLEVVRASLRDLEAVLDARVDESDADRVRIRLELSATEELMRRRLGRTAAALTDNVQHLNETPGLQLKSLQEIAGPRWPEVDTN